MLFFQLYSLVECGVSLLFGAPGSSPYKTLITSFFPLSLVVLSKVAFVLLWAVYILPRLMVSFALPPFVTPEDETKLFKMLTKATNNQKSGLEKAKPHGAAKGTGQKQARAGQTKISSSHDAELL